MGEDTAKPHCSALGMGVQGQTPSRPSFMSQLKQASQPKNLLPRNVSYKHLHVREEPHAQWSLLQPCPL